MSIEEEQEEEEWVMCCCVIILAIQAAIDSLVGRVSGERGAEPILDNGRTATGADNPPMAVVAVDFTAMGVAADDSSGAANAAEEGNGEGMGAGAPVGRSTGTRVRGETNEPWCRVVGAHADETSADAVGTGPDSRSNL